MKLTYIAYQKMTYGKICSSNWFLMFSCICSLQKLYSHVPYPNFLAKHILLYLLFPNVDIFSKGCLTGLITCQGGVSQLPPTLKVVPKSHLSFKTQLVFSRHPETCIVLRTQILILVTEPSNFRDEKQLYKLSILLPFPCADFTEQGQLLAIQYKWSQYSLESKLPRRGQGDGTPASTKIWPFFALQAGFHMRYGLREKGDKNISTTKK